MSCTFEQWGQGLGMISILGDAPQGFVASAWLKQVCMQGLSIACFIPKAAHKALVLTATPQLMCACRA